MSLNQWDCVGFTDVHKDATVHSCCHRGCVRFVIR